MIARLVIAAALAGVVAGYALPRPSVSPQPGFIGHGCERAGGDIWAMDPSDLPHCQMVETWR